MAAWWEPYIRARARQLGLDPNAVVAVARAEGLSGSVGDAGTSYGPFQLHRGGALPAGRSRAWAESRAGIDYALGQIAGVARGQRGASAISNIVRRFERPQNPGAEIQRALSTYGGSGGGTPSATTTTVTSSPATSGTAIGNPRAALATALIAASQATTEHQPPDYSPVLQAITSLRQAATAPAPATAPAAVPGMAVQTGRALGRAVLAPGADRPGVRTSAAVTRFVQRIAALVGHPLTIGTGTRHSRMTVNGNVSDHWSGHAADIPATGEQLIALGQAALIAAGANPRWARRQRGGLYNVRGHQVIFNTHQGGDHTNHLHVSAY